MKVHSKKNSWTKTECQIAYDEGCIQRKINFDQVLNGDLCLNSASYLSPANAL